MNTILWILQALSATIFVYSGVCKSSLPIKQLVYEKGQTGVEFLSLPFVRFIGVSEILGAIALILPVWLNIMPVLTPISAILLALIMVPAGVIHYKRKEPKNVLTNIILFSICLFIAYQRIAHL
ncbi:MAG TPA: DoxX family protein [Mucilaginibacter sp.]|jgi:uncharacterized membrane protein YphA (DoxX/SURF4 family)